MDEIIKGRKVFDERKQRSYIKIKYASSPTVSLEAIMVTSAIDAHEGRDVATIYIPGNYLHSYSYGEVIMILEGRLAEILVSIYPNIYIKYVVLEKGVNVLYVKLPNAIYGLLHSKLLFYLKLATDLKNNGFIINPYDPCVSKKLVRGEDMTVVWHVDYPKVLHKDPFEATKFAQYLSMIYGNKLKANRGNIDHYLGMNLEYSDTGVVEALMMKCLHNVLDEFIEELRGTPDTPEADHMFQLKGEDEADVLEEDRAEMFHH